MKFIARKTSVSAAVFSIALLALLFLPLLSAQPSSNSKWEKDIQAFEAADKTNPPPVGAILFLGASTTRLWKSLARDFPEYTVINRGFGGSQTSDAVFFADRIAIPYKPRLIVLQEGGNDINAGKTPEQVLSDFIAFADKVRAKLPHVRIAFTSLNPSPARWFQAEAQKKANQLVKEYVAKGQNLDFIDLWDAFLGPDGQPQAELFVADRLHNNEAGYKVRADLVRPHLSVAK